MATEGTWDDVEGLAVGAGPCRITRAGSRSADPVERTTFVVGAATVDGRQQECSRDDDPKHGRFNVIYTDVLDKENVYTALSRQNGRLLNTLQC